MSKQIRILVIVFIGILASFFIAERVKPDTPKNLHSMYSESAFSPLANDEYLEFEPSRLSMQENGVDYENYWVVTSIGIANLLNSGVTHETRELTQCLMDTFDRHGYFPRPAYQDFEYGWVSCMDAPAIAVLAQLMYEETQEEQYQIFVDKLSKYMLADVSEHGYIADINDKKWIFEYANENVTIETGEFVLNGSLVGTLGTAMIASVTQNNELQALVESQTALYKDMMEQFWYRDGSWCYYMLNSKAVNQPHYVIFEIRLFEALAEVTGDEFYQTEMQRRIDLLKQYYKLYIYEENGAMRYVFPRGGAPHYYYIDIYNTELVFYDESNTEIARERMEGRDFEDAFMCGILPDGTTRVEWNVVPNVSWSVNMGDIDIVYVENKEDWTVLPVTFSATADGSVTGDVLTLQGDLSEEKKCNLKISLPTPTSIATDQIFALEVNNTSDITLSNNIVVYNSSGEGISRYLKSITPGKNLLVFALPGFIGHGLTPFEDLNSINLRIYTSAIEENPVEFCLGNMYAFDNIVQFYTYFTTGEYEINWGA